MPVMCVILLCTGAIAQLGERLHGMQEVVGSNPIGSINISPCNLKVCEKSFLCHPSRQMLCYTYDYTFGSRKYGTTGPLIVKAVISR
jgi:hypothetical protein